MHGSKYNLENNLPPILPHLTLHESFLADSVIKYISDTSVNSTIPLTEYSFNHSSEILSSAQDQVSLSDIFISDSSTDSSMNIPDCNSNTDTISDLIIDRISSGTQTSFSLQNQIYDFHNFQDKTFEIEIIFHDWMTYIENI